MPAGSEGRTIGAGQDTAEGLTRPTGLSSAEAQLRLERNGRNEIVPRYRPSLLHTVLAQLTDSVILVLVAATALTAIARDYPDLSIIVAVIVLNTGIGTAQQYRSDQALSALAAVTAPRASVRRDGETRDVEAPLVVEGDLLILAAGDIVAADARVFQAESMTVDESILTGEAVAVGKGPGDTVLSGSVITRGRGAAVVTGTGHRTMVGGLARSLERAAPPTPLQRQLSRLGRQLALAAAVAALVVVALNLLTGQSVETSLLLGISLAVAAIPESLPAVVTLSLALAGRALSRHGVLARSLSAVEALGSITVLAMDKTGTLTEGRMAVAVTWAPEDAPAPAGMRAGPTELALAALCSDACAGPDLVPERSDDPIEVALVEHATQRGIDLPALRAGWPRIAEVPFDAAAGRMITTHRTPSGAQLRITKGAPDVLLAGVLGTPAVQARLEELVSAGLRVLAVLAAESPAAVVLAAESPATAVPAAESPDHAVAAEAPLGPDRLVGLIGFTDPVRAEAPALVAAFRQAGVRPVMITGDHPRTAAAVGQAIGLGRRIELGSALPAQHADASSGRAAPGVDILARVRPEQKSLAVQALQDRGEVVAMTGDGVNDAPALRRADIGVAMGHGTEVAKQAAALVLTGAGLSGMVPAITEGRRVYANIQRFLRYALTGGTAEVLVMTLGPLLGMSLPLRAGQILWVNLLTHGLPGVAIGNEPAEPGIDRRGPRDPRARLLNRREWRLILALAAVVAGASAISAAWAAHLGRSGQSALFVSLTLAQLAVALGGKPPGARWRANRLLLVAVAANVGLIVAAVEFPLLQEAFRTRSLSAQEYLLALVLAALTFLVTRLLTARHVRSVT